MNPSGGGTRPRASTAFKANTEFACIRVRATLLSCAHLRLSIISHTDSRSVRTPRHPSALDRPGGIYPLPSSPSRDTCMQRPATVLDTRELLAPSDNATHLFAVRALTIALPPQRRTQKSIMPHTAFEPAALSSTFSALTTAADLPLSARHVLAARWSQLACAQHLTFTST